jgi:hypothetical protein
MYSKLKLANLNSSQILKNRKNEKKPKKKKQKQNYENSTGTFWRISKTGKNQSPCVLMGRGPNRTVSGR